MMALCSKQPSMLGCDDIIFLIPPGFRYPSMGLGCATYCKFGNFREDFIFAKLRICEVS